MPHAFHNIVSSKRVFSCLGCVGHGKDIVKEKITPMKCRICLTGEYVSGHAV